MPSSYDVTSAQLSASLSHDGVNPATVTEILNYLTSQGDFSGPSSTVVVQDGDYPPFVKDSNGALPQVVIVNGTGPVTFDDGAAGDPNLQVIVDVDADGTVKGDKNELVVVGDDTNTVHLKDSVNDLVLAGDGQNTIVGGAVSDPSSVGDGDR